MTPIRLSRPLRLANHALTGGLEFAALHRSAVCGSAKTVAREKLLAINALCGVNNR